MKITITMPTELRKKTEIVIQKNGQKFSTLVQALLKDYLKKEEGSSQSI